MDRSSFELSHDASTVDTAQLVELFASAWWAAGRTQSQARSLVDNSSVVLAVSERATRQLVGFARALTDRTYLAIIVDVIVSPQVRGMGVGSMIMDAMIRHPWIADSKSIELVCQPDLIAFYRRWGFTDQIGHSKLMRRTMDLSLTGDASSVAKTQQ